MLFVAAAGNATNNNDVSPFYPAGYAASSVISVAANVVPEKMARLCRDRDSRIHEELLPLFKALFVESNPIPVKFALHRMGRIRNELRLPLVPLSAEHEPTVADALRLAGAI